MKFMNSSIEKVIYLLFLLLLLLMHVAAAKHISVKMCFNVDMIVFVFLILFIRKVVCVDLIQTKRRKTYDRPKYFHRTLGNDRHKIESCLAKAASQQTQLSGMKLKKKFISYRRLKTLKHLVGIGAFPALIFLFMNILIENLLMQFFYIQICKMCFSKNILYQYLIFLSASLLKGFYIRLYSANILKKI